ncbi:DMT family transporter [Lacibacter sp. MH-610]|uniref:DMT family transporter n=1 Tax=Lacibacter sp. MH-610 TaxID=3020883 RepID=UPI003892B674
MNGKLISWALFIVLCIIWGSSFILMKEGLQQLTAYQVAAVRMLSAGVILLPFAYQGFLQVERKKLGLIVLTGIIGSFIPAILFCVAETKIDSALAGMLNALTPLCVILIGVLFFKSKTASKKIAGVIVGFAGMVLLFLTKEAAAQDMHWFYAFLVFLATLSYGLNVNILSQHLKQVSSLHIASIAFVSLIIPAVAVLWADGFFNHSFTQKKVLWSVGASAVLGVFGTAIASVLFYMLMKRAGALFSSMVTYGIPFVAVGWGLIYGESITPLQLLGLLIILCGVYIANK